MSLFTLFREVNKVHTKPETFDAKSCECMISMHYEERFCEQSSK